VAEILGTEVLENREGSLGECCMSNVKLPVTFEEVVSLASKTKGVERGKLEKDAIGSKVLNWITSLLVEEYGTFMAIMWYGGAWWVRFSGQVYLEEEGDFEWAGHTLNEVCGRVGRGEFMVQNDIVRC